MPSRIDSLTTKKSSQKELRCSILIPYYLSLMRRNPFVTGHSNDAEGPIGRLQQLIDGARAQGIPVVQIFHVEEEGVFSLSSGHVETITGLSIAPDAVFYKHSHSALVGADGRSQGESDGTARQTGPGTGSGHISYDGYSHRDRREEHLVDGSEEPLDTAAALRLTRYRKHQPDLEVSGYLVKVLGGEVGAVVCVEDVGHAADLPVRMPFTPYPLPQSKRGSDGRRRVKSR
jgi:hypothetical protein